MTGDALLNAFREKAARLSEHGENLITAGAPGERVLLDTRRGGFAIRRLPNDPLALRISIGEAHGPGIGDSAYLVYRGDPATIVTLLRRALAALDSEQ